MKTTIVYRATPPRSRLERHNVNPYAVKIDCCGGMTKDITIALETDYINSKGVEKAIRDHLPNCDVGTIEELGTITYLINPMPAKNYFLIHGLDPQEMRCTVQGREPQVLIEIDEQKAQILRKMLREYSPRAKVYESEAGMLDAGDGVMVFFGKSGF